MNSEIFLKESYIQCLQSLRTTSKEVKLIYSKTQLKPYLQYNFQNDLSLKL